MENTNWTEEEGPLEGLFTAAITDHLPKATTMMAIMATRDHQEEVLAGVVAAGAVAATEEAEAEGAKMDLPKETTVMTTWSLSLPLPPLKVKNRVIELAEATT